MKFYVLATAIHATHNDHCDGEVDAENMLEAIEKHVRSLREQCLLDDTGVLALNTAAIETKDDLGKIHKQWRQQELRRTH